MMNDDKTQVLIVEMCTRSPPFVTYGSTSLTNCYGTSQSGQKAEEKCDEDELLNTAKFNCTHAIKLEIRNDNISSGDHVEYSRRLDWIRFCYVTYIEVLDSRWRRWRELPMSRGNLFMYSLFSFYLLNFSVLCSITCPSLLVRK